DRTQDAREPAGEAAGPRRPSALRSPASGPPSAARQRRPPRPCNGCRFGERPRLAERLDAQGGGLVPGDLSRLDISGSVVETVQADRGFAGALANVAATA